MIFTRLKTVFTLILIITLSLGSMVHAQAKDQDLNRIKKHLIQCNFYGAKMELRSSSLEEKNPAMYNAIKSITDYQSASWFPGDLSRIKESKKDALPLILEIVQAPVSKELAKTAQFEAVIDKTRFMAVLAELDYQPAIPVLIGMLKDKDVYLRGAAVEALKKLRAQKAAEPLFKYLQQEHIPDTKDPKELAILMKMEEGIRIQAVAALAEIKNKELIPVLEKEIEKSGSPDRMTAVIVLTGYRFESLKPTYIKLLNDREERVRIYAASALKDLGDERGLETLMDLFKKGNEGQKLWVFNVMSTFPSKKTAKYFIDYLKDESKNSEIGYVPLISLGKPPVTERLLDPHSRLITEMVQLLIDWEKTAAPLLYESLKSEDKFRYIAAEILGASRDPKAVEIFKKELDSKDELIQYYAIWALGRVKDKSSVKKISGFLNHKNDNLKLAAAWYLANVGDDSGYKTAVKFLSNSDQNLAATALDALYHLRTEKSISPILENLEKGFKDPLLRKYAFVLLGITGDSTTAEKLEKFIDEPGPISFYAAQSIYILTGKEARYSARYVFPEEFGMYGGGLYSDKDMARMLLLYLAADEKYGTVLDMDLGFVRISTKEAAGDGSIPLTDLKDENRKIADLIEGIPMFIEKYEGTQAVVLTLNGKRGKVDAINLLMFKDALNNSRLRFKLDFRYRNPEDLARMIKRDYLNDAEISVQYSNPEALAHREAAETMLNLANRLTGFKAEPGDFDSLLKSYDPGEKKVTIKMKRPSKTFIFTFNGKGKLILIKVR